METPKVGNLPVEWEVMRIIWTLGPLKAAPLRRFLRIKWRGR